MVVDVRLLTYTIILLVLSIFSTGIVIVIIIIMIIYKPALSRYLVTHRGRQFERNTSLSGGVGVVYLCSLANASYDGF